MKAAKLEKLIVLVAVLSVGQLCQVTDAGWVAYNDCIRQTGDSTAANVTDWTIYEGYTGHNTGKLKDFATGSDAETPTVTFTMNSAAPVKTHIDYGDNFAAGTPAHSVFNEKVDFSGTILQHSSAMGWWVEIEFTGLDPTKMYAFVGTAVRISPSDLDRISLFTIKDAVSYVNNSGYHSIGDASWVGTDTTKFLAVGNATEGVVVRWDDIEPGPDGDFTVRAEADSSAGSHGRRGYPFAGFMLEEVGAAGNRSPQVDAGEYDLRTWPSNVFQLDASVYDDDPCGFGILTLKWSKLNGPGTVTFSPGDDIEDPCAIFSAPGEYELLLQAWDEVPQEANDVAAITIIEPNCPVGDLNGNCVVDFDDLKILTSQWLEDPGCSGFSCPDLDGIDGVGMRDYTFLAYNWLESWLGSLRVTIYPPEAVQAGAQWRVDSGSWRDSDQDANGLPVGQHTVDFKQVQGWVKPNNQIVQVYKDQASVTSGTYVELPDSALIISEFMAVNSYVPFINPNLNIYTEVYGFDVHPDWIELHSLDSVNAIDLEGWYLTNDAGDLTKWRFPSGVSISPNGYYVLFASGKKQEDNPGNYPFVDGDGALHTNFVLGSEGDNLALVQPDGMSVAHEYTPEYPEQRGFVSYGISSGGGYGYLITPTPGSRVGDKWTGAANSAKYDGAVADTKFDPDRGFYYGLFGVTISCVTPGATIRYTINGSEPTMSNGSTYNDTPILINTTTCLRAAAFKTGWLPTNVDTQTYIFPAHVVVQSNAQAIAAGYPSYWGYGADYEMDPEIYNAAAYHDVIQGALLSVPTLSVAMDKDHLFGSSGIYTNPTQRGISWERPTSAEFFDANGIKEFQVNCGIRIQGGASRNPNKAPKHSLSLRFRGGYGPGELEYELFNGSPVDRFNSLHLRAMYNNSWIHWDSGQRSRGSMIRDQWMRDSLLDMGDPGGGYGTYVHLYLNGLYWGVYNVHERPDAEHYASYYGGNDDQLDALNSGAAVDGSALSWNNLHNVVAAAVSGGISLSEYQQIQQKLDVVNLIDYMMVNHYGGNSDWDNHNWRAAGGGVADMPWRIFSWDAERVLESVSTNRTGQNSSGDPSRLFYNLLNSVEFKMLLADRVHKHLFNDGTLMAGETAARWMERATELDLAIICESARWGDYRRDVHSYSNGPYYLYSRNDHWLPEQNRLINDYFPKRTKNPLNSSNLLNQYKGRGWYPGVEAPVFTPHGGWDLSGFIVTMTNPNGSGIIWYTVDGADPRLPGGSVNTSHVAAYSGPLSLSASTQVKARVLDAGTWSALNEATYGVGQVADYLRITEIMYHPQNTGDPNDPNEEFIELTNIGSPQPLNLNLVRFTRGIYYTFPNRELAAGEYVLVVKDQAAFNAQYPGLSGLIAGEFSSGSLANDGERIKLEDAIGQTIHYFRYKDGWYDVTDGLGFSLTIRDACNIDPCDWGQKSSWGASTHWGGSPGEGDDGPKVGDIVITEILAHSDVEVYDWVELHNPTDRTISIGGWFLSDSGGSDANLMKYQIPTDTTLGLDEYITITEIQFGDLNDPGCYVPFALSENGETLYLSSGIPGELTLTGFRDERDFRASDPDVAFGLYTKSSQSASAGDPTDFVAMSQNSKGFANTYPPKVGPIVIAEIMYHPEASADPGQEYIKLVNISDSEVTLQRYDPEKDVYVQWKFTDGIRYTFPPDTTIAAGDYIYVVYDPAEFSSAYPSVPSSKIFGPFEDNDEGERTKLDNAGEDVELSKPGDTDDLTDERYYILVDRVNYSDGKHPKTGYIDPWPTEPDGDGQSLHRIALDEYGNDVVNWQAASP